MIVTRALVVVTVFSMTFRGIGFAQRDSACVDPPNILAVARPDNDISFADSVPQAGSDGVAIPLAVKEKIDALAKDACFGIRAHSDEPRALKDFYAGAFYIRAPDGLSLYVFDCDYGLGGRTFFFILFAPVSRKVTPDPPSIYGKWAVGVGNEDDILHRPFVAFEDLDHDGWPELVARELTHNGTSYNASVRHYYRIGRDLSLLPMLAVEEKSLQDVRPPNTYLLRRVRYVSPDTLVLITSLSVPPHPDRDVGEVVVAKNQTFGYHVVTSRAIDSRYRDALITDSPAHDDNFIFTGWTVRY